MTASPVSYIPDILDEHLEELQVLLSHRATLLRSPFAYLRDLANLDERLLAHLDGIKAVGESALPAVAALLDADDTGSVQAAMFALLHLDARDALPRAAESFRTAQGERLIAMGEVMLLGPANATLPLAESRARDADSLATVVSARVIARFSARRPRAEGLAALVRDPSPLVRRQAWLLDAELELALDAKSYAVAMRDDDPSAKREGMFAAARCSIAGVLTIARKAAEKPTKESADALRLLAVLATREDEKRMKYVVTEPTLGPLRFELAGLHGSPAHIDLLLEAMRNDDPRTAIAAGAAFRRMTGMDVESTHRAMLPPEDGSTRDEFEAEFLDEALLPDPIRAKERWERVAPGFTEAQRICGGLDATGALPAVDSLDMDSRWWHMLRARFNQWSVNGWSDATRFPAALAV